MSLGSRCNDLQIHCLVHLLANRPRLSEAKELSFTNLPQCFLFKSYFAAARRERTF